MRAGETADSSLAYPRRASDKDSHKRSRCHKLCVRLPNFSELDHDEFVGFKEVGVPKSKWLGYELERLGAP